MHEAYTLARNKLHLFSSANKPPKKHQTKVSMLKSDCNLFARLYVACQARDGNLDEFFSHENHQYPTALSPNGKLQTSMKSELLQGIVPDDLPNNTPNTEMIILYGAAIVIKLQPRKARTFDEKAQLVILHHIAHFQVLPQNESVRMVNGVGQISPQQIERRPMQNL